MKGHWQKEVPSKSGNYHTAYRDGEYAGVKTVRYGGSNLVFEHGFSRPWFGWWWSEPIEIPEPPKAEDWDR